MSQYKSTMFSDAVYLFGNTIASAPSWGDSEELPDGTQVSQKISQTGRSGRICLLVPETTHCYCSWRKETFF